VISRHPHFEMRHLWYLSVATVTLQMVVNLALLHREFGRKLKLFDVPVAPPAPIQNA
jgi:hypothetical protein